MLYTKTHRLCALILLEQNGKIETIPAKRKIEKAIIELYPILSLSLFLHLAFFCTFNCWEYLDV